MAYRVQAAPEVGRTLAALPKKIRRQLAKKIDSLAENPRPAGCKKLSGGEEFYRLRSGDYRILYHVRDKARLVLVVRVGHRREIYRR